MKYLTLDLYERIVDAFHEQTRNNLKLLGHVTRDECGNYIGYYGIHGGLFWSEQEGKICGVATAHPGKKHFDWKWDKADGIWTTHCVWAENKSALAEVISDFIYTRKVQEFYACRKGKLSTLNEKKLERILFYGGKRQHHNSSSSSSELSRVNALNLGSADSNGSPDLCQRS